MGDCMFASRFGIREPPVFMRVFVIYILYSYLHILVICDVEGDMRVAIYCRVSTDRQGTENQALQLREFAAKQGWTVSHEYVDCESGGKADRSQF